MYRQSLVLIAAVALGISACSDSASPTAPGRDLLNNPADAPALGESKYGQIANEEEPGEGTDPGGGTPTPPPLYHISNGPKRSQYAADGDFRFHITDGPSVSIYTKKQQYHVASGPDASKYELSPGTTILPVPVDPWGNNPPPIFQHHITSGPKRSQQAFDGDYRFHITEGPSVSIYTIKQQYHVASGADASQYKVAP